MDVEPAARLGARGASAAPRTATLSDRIFIHTPAGGMVDLGAPIRITGVAGINSAGQVAVTGQTPDLFGHQRAAILEPVAPADVTADGRVDVDDLIAVIIAWGSADAVADISGNGVVEVDDLIAVMVNWT